MIAQVEKLLRVNWSQWGMPDPVPNTLHFVKMQAGEGSLAKRVNFLVFADGRSEPDLVMKTVRDPVFADLVDREHQALIFLNRRLAKTEVVGTIPRPIYRDVIGDQAFSLETAARGNRLTSLDFVQESSLQMIFDWLVTVHLAVCRPAAPLSSSEIADLVADPIEAFISAYGIASAGDVEELRDIVLHFEALSGRSFRTIPQHGDLTPANVFICNDTLCVIDFEYFGQIQLPLYDLFHFLRRFTPLARGCRLDENFMAATRWWMERYLDALEIDQAFLSPLVYLAPVYSGLRKKVLSEHTYVRRRSYESTVEAVRALKALY